MRTAKFRRMTPGAAARVALAGGLALGVSACQAVKAPKIADPSIASSLAGRDVVAAAERPGPYPRFEDIPRVPSDVRATAAWTLAVNDMQARRAVLADQIAALPTPATDTEAFSAAMQAGLPAKAAPVAPDAAAAAAAYSRALRARATPPPPRQ